MINQTKEREKAKELLHRMYKVENANFYTAKNSSLIAIEEMLSSDYLKEDMVHFWVKVKEEVESL
jgi:hypothetical protein